MTRTTRMAMAAVLALALPAGEAAAQGRTCGITVFFNSGQTQISREARDTLIGFARDYPGAEMIVTGYADAAGSAAENQAVSLRRAQSVAAALEGVRLVAVTGAGSAVRPGTTGPSDPRNRRVEALRQDCGDVPSALDSNVGLAAGAGIAAIAIGAAIAGGDDDDGSGDSTGGT